MSVFGPLHLECQRGVAQALTVCIASDVVRVQSDVVLSRRAVVTAEDGSVRWVDMPTPGQETFLTDYSGGGTKGAIWRNKRYASDKVAFHQYGYNQARPAA